MKNNIYKLVLIGLLSMFYLSSNAMTFEQSAAIGKGVVSRTNFKNHKISIGAKSFKISNQLSEQQLKDIKQGSTVKYYVNDHNTITSIWIELSQ
ncbi:MAG TPA: hypothetical protein ENJ60_11780 [Aeromonadales bacterium]|nr:hypothetical protein [Aeromonadales bacterium]